MSLFGRNNAPIEYPIPATPDCLGSKELCRGAKVCPIAKMALFASQHPKVQLHSGPIRTTLLRVKESDSDPNGTTLEPYPFQFPYKLRKRAGCIELPFIVSRLHTSKAGELLIPVEPEDDLKEPMLIIQSECRDNSIESGWEPPAIVGPEIKER